MVLRISGIELENVPLPGANNNDNGDDAALLRQMRAAKAEKPDEFSRAKSKKKKEHFSGFRAGKEFTKGVFRPIGMMIKHPFKTIAAIAATLTLASFAPVTIPILAVAGLGFGGYQVAKGTGKAALDYARGDYKGAEKAFGDIGEGTVAVAASAAGVRTGGAIAAEAKTTASALKTATTSAEKMKAIETGLDEGLKVQQGSWTKALKENTSLVTHPEGRKALYSQLNPRAIFSNTTAKIKETVRMFRQAPVSKTDDKMRAAQKHLGIADEDMPTLVRNLIYEDKERGIRTDQSARVLGFYNPKTHSLHVQPNAFQHLKDALPQYKPFMEKLPTPLQNFLGNSLLKRYPADNLVTHEMTHARQSLEMKKLNPDQAIAAIKQGFPDMSENHVSSFLKEWNFAKGQTALSKDEVKQAQQTLIGFIKAVKGSAEIYLNILKGKGLRPYIAAPAEIEARQQGNQFGINQALSTLDKTKRLSSAKGTQAMQNLRNGIVETRLNNHLNTLNQLAETDASAEQIQKEEAALQATRTIFGASNPTGRMLKSDQKFKNEMKSGKKAEQLIQKWKASKTPAPTTQSEAGLQETMTTSPAMPLPPFQPDSGRIRNGSNLTYLNVTDPIGSEGQ